MSYYFVRFICPALALPARNFHLELGSSVKRLCVIVSKMLQAVANNQSFESETMQFANEFVTSVRTQKFVTLFLDILSETKLTFEDRSLYMNCRDEFLKMRGTLPLPQNSYKTDQGTEFIPMLGIYLSSKEYQIRKKIMEHGKGEESGNANELISDLVRDIEMVEKSLNELSPAIHNLNIADKNSFDSPMGFSSIPSTPELRFKLVLITRKKKVQNFHQKLKKK